MDAFDHEAELERCARRDASAFRRLYEREAGTLLGIALRIVRRRDVARDIVHDAFLDLWIHAKSFDRSRGNGRVWIVSLVRHRALKHARRAGRETLEPDAGIALASDEADPFAALADVQDATALHRCLSTLPRERQLVIRLAYIEGLSQTEIAARLTTPLGTIKAWVRRSLLSLKDCLDDPARS